MFHNIEIILNRFCWKIFPSGARNQN